jgi:hypothetical protein
MKPTQDLIYKYAKAYYRATGRDFNILQFEKRILQSFLNYNIKRLYFEVTGGGNK